MLSSPTVPMLLLVVVCTILSCQGSTVRYDGHKVLRVDVNTERDLQTMKTLQTEEKLDFWKFPQDVMVPPEKLATVEALLDAAAVRYDVMIADVQELIDSQVGQDVQEIYQPDLAGYDFTRYYNLSEIEQWVKEMATTYPSLAAEVQIGTSYEGRELRTLKVGSAQNSSKEAVWIHGGIHAREWISPATVMFMTNQLVVDYATDANVQKYLDTYDFYILPVMNPDGYEFTWVENRMWRKTRSPNDGSSCAGTDGNRNFEYMWGGTGSSTDPCASDYRGAFAHSESEVAAVADFIVATSQKQQFALFIDFHCYGQLWATPWCYTAELPLHYPDQSACANAAAAAIQSVYGTVYTAGNVIGPGGTGLTLDWGYGSANIVHSYLVELRDTGEYGFLLPEDQIIPSGEETYEGLKAVLDHILNNPVLE